MVDCVIDAVRSLPAPLAVFVLAMVPLTELRAAIPVGVLALGMHPLTATLTALAGNLVPVAVAVWGLEPVARVGRRWSPVDRVLGRLFEMTRTRHERRFERYRDLALILLVAVPLPGTGGYSGSLASFVFGVRPRRGFVLVSVGVALSAALVGTLVATGVTVFGVDT